MPTMQGAVVLKTTGLFAWSGAGFEGQCGDEVGVKGDFAPDAAGKQASVRQSKQKRRRKAIRP